jgi:phosphonate transport system substrate-binding protein
MLRNGRKIAAIILMLALCLPVPMTSHSAQKKLLIGLIPEMNLFKQKQRFKLLGDYLSKKTGIPVEFTILSRYGNIIESFTAEKMDGAFFGSFTGALAIRKLGVVPMARPVNPDGSSTYKGYLFVRKDSGIRTAADMQGKRMAFVDKATTAGYVFPLAWLRDNGVTAVDGFFSEQFFTGSHDAAVLAVLNQKADVGAAKNTIYERVRKDEPRVDRELAILASSREVPSNGLCVRKDLDAAVRAALKDALLTLHNDPEGRQVLEQFGALRFIETSPKDYQPVLDMAKKAGIDLHHYQYRNE